MREITHPIGQTPHRNHRNALVRPSLLPCAGRFPFPNPPQLRAKNPHSLPTNPTGCAPASGVERAAIPRRLWPLQKSLSYCSNYALAADCRAGFQFWISAFCFPNFCFRLSDHIRKSALHLAEIPDAAQTEGGGQNRSILQGVRSNRLRNQAGSRRQSTMAWTKTVLSSTV